MYEMPGNIAAGDKSNELSKLQQPSGYKCYQDYVCMFSGVCINGIFENRNRNHVNYIL